MIDVEQVRERLAVVEARIRAAGGTGVDVLAVTKGFGADAIDAAIAVGCRRIGENYAQELLDKLRQRGESPDGSHIGVMPEIHFIGRLQSNKVRSLTGVVDVYESVDRPSLVTAIARRSPGARVLVQVDTTGEPGKGGCPLDEVANLVATANVAGLRVEGLMTVGPTEGGPGGGARRLPRGPRADDPARPSGVLDGDDGRPRGRRGGGQYAGTRRHRAVRVARREVML